MTKAISLFFIATIACWNTALATMLSIPMVNDTLPPADDLVYLGNNIDQIEALELRASGIDLSKLEPELSSLYRGTSIELEDSNSDKDEFRYYSSLTAPTEFFRFTVKNNDKKYTLTASLYNHQSLLRAAILKKIGYDVPTPKYLHQFKLNFKSIDEKKHFIEQLVQSTLLSQKRWIAQNNPNELSLTLKGFILEPSQIKNVAVYWPIMQLSRQKTRRSFRSLLHLFTLTDFQQNINNIPWTYGKVFNEKLVLSHAYAGEFVHTTIDDFKWMHQKIIKLSEEDFTKILAYSQYPKPIQLLLKEKIKARLNYLSNMLGLEANYRVNSKITAPGINAGKIIENDFSAYIPTFWSEDPLSPYRFSEMLKYFRHQVSYDTISSVLDTAMKRFVPNIDSGDAIDEIANRVKLYARQNGEIPLKFWVFPTFGTEASGKRSIVFGQYEASVAPIQLVDTINFKVQAGLFGLVSGLPGWIKPAAALNGSIQRSWSHVRAMPDLTAATQQKIRKLLIPSLMKKLGRVISQDYQCSVTQNAWVNEEVIGTMRTWVIYYDKEDLNGKQAALILRQDLIAEEIPADQILLSAVLKEDICQKERTEKINKTIEDFIKEFAMNETFTITDSLLFNSKLGAKVSIDAVNQLSADVNWGYSKAKLRSYILRKTADGIEVIIQNQQNTTNGVNAGVKFVAELMSNTTRWTKGHMLSHVYKIKLVDINEEEKLKAISTLREILIKGSYQLLKELYLPTKLDSNARLRTNTFRFLWHKVDKLRMQHEVEVTVANVKPTQNEPTGNDDFWEPPTPLPSDLSEDERKRTLYSAQSTKRVGNNYHEFADRLLRGFTFDWVSTGASDQDPGRSVLGKSWKQTVVTESELTQKYDLKATTKFELSYVGYRGKYKKINKYLGQYDYMFSYKGSNFEIDRGIFNQMSYLYSYDLRGTVIFYPSALDKIEVEILANKNISTVLSSLKTMYGKRKWESRCRDMFVEGGLRACVPGSVKYILNLRKNGFSAKRKLKTIQINNLYVFLMNTLQRPRVLEFLGTDHFFGTVYIGGFRSNDSEGYLQYTSDSVGTYQEELGTGLFDHFANVLGITAYTVKALEYTGGM
jgi:hypothetical protein